MFEYAFHMHCRACLGWEQTCSAALAPPKQVVCFLPGLPSWGAELAFGTPGASLSCSNSASPPGIPGSLSQYLLVRHGIKKEDKNRLTDPLGQAGAG